MTSWKGAPATDFFPESRIQSASHTSGTGFASSRRPLNRPSFFKIWNDYWAVRSVEAVCMAVARGGFLESLPLLGDGPDH